MAMRLDHGTDELGEVHGINVTPFINVMLVLLIIFMVAAALATVETGKGQPAAAKARLIRTHGIPCERPTMRRPTVDRGYPARPMQNTRNCTMFVNRA